MTVDTGTKYHGTKKGKVKQASYSEELETQFVTNKVCMTESEKKRIYTVRGKSH